MSLTAWIWLAVGAYGIHILEEFEFNWRDWARAVFGLPVEWTDFHLVNALVIVLGIVAAELAVATPLVALGLPALMLINATFFHVLPMILKRGRYSPGVFTAVVLFYPIGIACYVRAAAEDHFGIGTLLGSFALGAALMATPIVLLHLKTRPYFRQDRP